MDDATIRKNQQIYNMKKNQRVKDIAFLKRYGLDKLEKGQQVLIIDNKKPAPPAPTKKEIKAQKVASQKEINMWEKEINLKAEKKYLP